MGSMTTVQLAPRHCHPTRLVLFGDDADVGALLLYGVEYLVLGLLVNPHRDIAASPFPDPLAAFAGTHEPIPYLLDPLAGLAQHRLPLYHLLARPEAREGRVNNFCSRLGEAKKEARLKDGEDHDIADVTDRDIRDGRNPILDLH